jgi:zeaxanthin glucosyltransferase
MKLGFICPNLIGHLNPMTALARHLQDRNHDVVFLYSSGAAGLPFVPGPEKDHLDEKRPEQSKMQGEDALKFGVGTVLAQTETILKSLPAVVQANGIDALLIDTVQFYAELGAIQLGMPYIQVSNALHFDFSGYTPLSVYLAERPRISVQRNLRCHYQEPRIKEIACCLSLRLCSPSRLSCSLQ